MASVEIRELCTGILASRSKEDLDKLHRLISAKDAFVSVLIHRDLLAMCFLLLRENSNENAGKTLKNDERIVVISILENVLLRMKIDKEIVFFNLLSILLSEIYNVEMHCMKNLGDEHNLAVVTCLKALFNCTDSELTLNLYEKRNGAKFSRVIYALLQLIKNSNFRNLRIEGIACLNSLFQTNSEDDLILRSQIAESFSYFLPGISTILCDVATENRNKAGYKLIKAAVGGFGRIVSLLLQNYSGELGRKPGETSREVVDPIEIYMNTPRDSKWFKKSDEHLSKLFKKFQKLTQHPVCDVRLELCEMCERFVYIRSFGNISFRYIVLLVIVLSGDERVEIARNSLGIHGEVMRIVGENQVLENSLHAGFHEAVSELTSIFNGIDDAEKIAILKLVTGYVEIFGDNLKLNENFMEFCHNLVHLCEFQCDVQTFHENIIEGLEHDGCSNMELWKNLKFLENEAVRHQFRNLCHSLVKHGNFELFSSFLTTFFLNSERKNATFFLNELISGLPLGKIETNEAIESVFRTYTDELVWNVPLEISTEYSIGDVRNNILQAALLVEGLGEISEVSQKNFRKMLLKSLFLVLSRAGSKQPLIRASGKRALRKISNALRYATPTELLNDNMDYIVFFIERNLKKPPKEFTFDVLEIVMTYGDETTLDSLIGVIEGILVQSCDKFKENFVVSYLEIFKVFLRNLTKWFGNFPKEELKFLSRTDKKQQINIELKVGGLEEEITDFSDEIMDKSAEEMYKEDMARPETQCEMSEIEGDTYKKELPPNYIKLTVEILRRCLNFLPSKEKLKKILVLEILNEGIFLIQNYEDELLPMVHQIWSPLIGRFSEKNEPVLINHSFRLLCNLGKFSKEFIRNRTIKDVSPKLLEILLETSRESLLKDRGSSYRYTQSFKLQTILLEELPYLVNNLDFPNDEIAKIMDVVFLYLNCKQPLPLQNAAVSFMRKMLFYDSEFCKNKLEKLMEEHENSHADYSSSFLKIKN